MRQIVEPPEGAAHVLLHPREQCVAPEAPDQKPVPRLASTGNVSIPVEERKHVRLCPAAVSLKEKMNLARERNPRQHGVGAVSSNERLESLANELGDAMPLVALDRH